MALQHDASVPAFDQWTVLPAFKHSIEALSTVQFGSKFFIDSNSRLDDNNFGAIELQFDNESGRITSYSAIKYPSKFAPHKPSMCGGYRSDSTEEIIIVDGRRELPYLLAVQIARENDSKVYHHKLTEIPEMGFGTSSLMIKGNVHIINGVPRRFQQCLIYSTLTGKVQSFKTNLDAVPIIHAAFMKRDDDSEFYRFGGLDCDGCKPVHSFYIGTLQDGDATKPIIWKKAPHFRLKIPLVLSAVIQTGPFIVTFGGEKSPRGLTELFSDKIYVLDTRSKIGWIESKIKCPMAERWVAVLDQRQRVHLFNSGSGNHNKVHFCIALKRVIPEAARFNASQNPEMFGLMETIHTLNAMLEERLNEVNGLKKERESLYQKQQELEEEVKRFQRIAVEVREELQFAFQKLNEEIYKLKDEQKESQMTIIELRKKVKELEMEVLNPLEFMEWDSDQIHRWIMGLERGRFRKYEKMLRKALSAHDVVGNDLLDVNPLTIKMWGIKDRKDCEALNKYIQELVDQHELYQNEGQ